MVLNYVPPVLKQHYVKFLLKEIMQLGWMAITWYTYRFHWETYFKCVMVITGHCSCC